MENPGHSDPVTSFRWRMSPARDTSPGPPMATPGDRSFSRCRNDQLAAPVGNSLKQATPVKPFWSVRTVRLNGGIHTQDLSSSLLPSSPRRREPSPLLEGYSEGVTVSQRLEPSRQCYTSLRRSRAHSGFLNNMHKNREAPEHQGFMLEQVILCPSWYLQFLHVLATCLLTFTRTLILFRCK